MAFNITSPNTWFQEIEKDVIARPTTCSSANDIIKPFNYYSPTIRCYCATQHTVETTSEFSAKFWRWSSHSADVANMASWEHVIKNKIDYCYKNQIFVQTWILVDVQDIRLMLKAQQPQKSLSRVLSTLLTKLSAHTQYQFNSMIPTDHLSLIIRINQIKLRTKINNIK